MSDFSNIEDSKLNATSQLDALKAKCDALPKMVLPSCAEFFEHIKRMHEGNTPLAHCQLASVALNLVQGLLNSIEMLEEQLRREKLFSEASLLHAEFHTELDARFKIPKETRSMVGRNAGQAAKPSRRLNAEPGEIKAGDIEADGARRMARDSSREARAQAVSDLSEKHGVSERHVRNCLIKIGWVGREKKTNGTASG